jgi:peptidoglycan/xylan/chitin deacetylase (PgdA/CDA1 family)
MRGSKEHSGAQWCAAGATAMKGANPPGRLGWAGQRMAALAGRARHAPAILMYHRVARAACDPWGLCVTPENFRTQLAALKRHRTVMAMDDLVDALASARVPPRATALTFDDGYADNFVVAKPILEELRVPATMFLTSGIVGCEQPFWWDELAHLVLLNRNAARFDLEVAGARLAGQWDDMGTIPSDLPRWRVHHPTDDPRRLAYIRLWQALQAMPSSEREHAMGALKGALPHDGAHEAATFPMSREAAGALASSLISIGGHGRTHTPLPLLESELLHDEVAGGRAEVASLTAGQPPAGFAFPHGEHDAVTRQAVADAGYRWAVTTRRAKVDPRACNLFALPRIAAQDWSGAMLLLRLRLVDARAGDEEAHPASPAPKAPAGHDDRSTRNPPTVAVVIPTYNRAGYLRDALRSVREQTRPVDEIIVVDDGSDDDTAAVVAQFPGVTFIRQANAGPSAARNAGIRAARADYVLCLDSDDVLVPSGIESSLACMAENPGVAFTYGAFSYADASLRPISRPHFSALPHQAYRDLLQGNAVAMLGTVLFDRGKLLAAGGFDPALDRAEDYDLFLRLAREHPIAGDPALVARYRRHGGNLTERSDEMLRAALAVQERNRPDESDAAGMRAYRRGKKRLARIIASGAWQAGTAKSGTAKRKERLAMARVAPLSSIAAVAWRLARRTLPESVAERLREAVHGQRRAVWPVQMGDLQRTRPIGRYKGFERGTPIDRHYVEKFLARHSGYIIGRVLEAEDDGYSLRFGTKVERQDVLHVKPGAPRATIVGDLSRPGTLPQGVFDCMVLTFTLEFIYDLSSAVREIWNGLRPGGVALVALPGVGSQDRSEFTQFWSFTQASATRLFADVFGPGNVEVEAFGNVYAAVCFLEGLALEEVEKTWLDEFDPDYPVVITVRARRAPEPSPNPR